LKLSASLRQAMIAAEPLGHKMRPDIHWIEVQTVGQREWVASFENVAKTR
jgi:hypothetical protein